MVEKGATGGGQFDAVHAAAHQLNADLIFEISDLATEGRLRRVQPLLGGERQASLLCDRDEIAKVPQLHSAFHISRASPQLTKSFSPAPGEPTYGATDAVKRRNPWRLVGSPVSPAMPCVSDNLKQEE